MTGAGIRTLLTSLTLLTLLAFAVSAGGCGGSSGAATGATVNGTLTLPGTASGKPYFVRVMTALGGASVGEQTGLTSGSTTLPYSIAGVATGTYLLLAVVDVDNSGGTSSTTGDYRGWYGHNGDGNPPPTPNVVVPSSGTVTFDFSLVLAP